MKTKVYFVRHAEPDFSVKDDRVRPLSEKGMADTRRVTNALRDKDITVIYSSPFKRAIDTVKNFADSVGFEIVTRNDFCERRVGEWVEDFKAYSAKQWGDFDFKLPAGESLREVQERNIAALFKVVTENAGRSVAVGTHGTALSTVLNYFNQAFGHDAFWSIIDKMPYILCFTFEGMELESVEEVELP